MCGIIGEYNQRGNDENFIFRRDLLKHRGPDSQGFFVSADKKVRLGHRRLAILDLSSRGNQPMIIDDYSIVYNGEVYNFEKLREEIGGVFTSISDTEVILRGFIKFGPGIFKKLEGMFALAIYDQKNKKIILARDRMGVKPLYYYQDQVKFTFASEIPALGITAPVSMDAVRSFLEQNYIYRDVEIISGVKSLPAGSFAVFNTENKNFKTSSYFKLNFDNKITSLPVAIDQCLKVLRNSIKRSLVSDVPVGVFLSSGVDSSLITALTLEEKKNVKTFTIGFDFNSFDESKKAEEISRILGSDHQTFSIRKEDVIDQIPKILDQFSMPFGDSSAIPLYFISKYARKHVKVCLSGDGADELFGGYPTYYLPAISKIYHYLPIQLISEKVVDFLPPSFGKLDLVEKIKRFVNAAKYDYRLAHFFYKTNPHPDVLKKEFQVKSDYFLNWFQQISGEKIADQLMYVDQKTVLEKDYLIKVDRMSMAHSLEVRVPFLNQEVLDFSVQLDSRLKVKPFETKIILKKVLEKYLPKHLIYRKKQGFTPPIASWLCLELKDFMLETLSKKNIEKIKFLEYSGIAKMINDHLEKRRDYNRELWGLISLVRYLINSESYKS